MNVERIACRKKKSAGQVGRRRVGRVIDNLGSIKGGR